MNASRFLLKGATITLLCVIFCSHEIRALVAQAQNASDYSVESWLSATGSSNWKERCANLRTYLLKDVDKPVYETRMSLAKTAPAHASSKVSGWWLKISPDFKTPILSGDYELKDRSSPTQVDITAIRVKPSALFVSFNINKEKLSAEGEKQNKRLKSLFGHAMTEFELEKLPYRYILEDLNCDATTGQQIDEAERTGVALLVKRIADGNYDASSLQVTSDSTGSSLVKAGQLKGQRDRFFVNLALPHQHGVLHVSYKMNRRDNFEQILNEIFLTKKDLETSGGKPAWILKVEGKL